jgi:hypothetical protein
LVGAEPVGIERALTAPFPLLEIDHYATATCTTTSARTATSRTVRSFFRRTGIRSS